MRRQTFVDYATQAYMAVVGILILFFHNATVPHWRWLVAAHAAGIAFVAVLIRLHLRFPRNKSLDFLRHFYPIPCYLWFFSETGWLNRMFYPEFMDPLAIRWEQALFGCQPSVIFMHKLPYLLVSEIFYASYFSYYVMIFGVGLALYLTDRRRFFHYVSVISFIFYVCYVIYIFLPIIGPRTFFREITGYSLPPDVQQLAVTDVYPDAIKSGPFFHVMAWIYKAFEAPGAAFPSSHVAIAISTVFFSFRYLRPIRFPHLVVAVLLCLATIYCRYHYVVDVLAGLVTAAVLLPVANRLYKRFGEDSADQAVSRESKPAASVR